MGKNLKYIWGITSIFQIFLNSFLGCAMSFFFHDTFITQNRIANRTIFNFFDRNCGGAHWYWVWSGGILCLIKRSLNRIVDPRYLLKSLSWLVWIDLHLFVIHLARRLSCFCKHIYKRSWLGCRLFQPHTWKVSCFHGHSHLTLSHSLISMCRTSMNSSLSICLAIASKFS